jgi:O-antigen/teichoic acid export membrane protein
MTSGLLHRAPESEGETALRTHFTISLIFNIIWALAIAIFGFLLIDPEDRWILWIILATQFTDNLVQTSRTLLVRRVVFRRIALIDLISTLVSTASALILAWAGKGMWGLISTDIAAAAIALLGYIVIRPPWKLRLGWSNKVVRYLLGFGQRTFLANLIGQALDNIDNLWTGRYLGNEALGFYSRAYTFATYPRKVLSAPIISVASGTYAELISDHKRLSQAFFRVNAFLVRSGFLFSGILILIAPEFIKLVIGKQWLPMLTAFRLMVLYILLDPLKMTIANLFIAIGKPEKVLSSRLVQLAVMIIGLFIFGNVWGIEGVAVAVNLMLLTGIILLLRQAREFVQFSLWRLFAGPAFALVVSMVLARAAIEIPGVRSSLWLIGAVKGIVFLILYLAIIAILEKDQLPVVLGMLKQLRGNQRPPPTTQESSENQQTDE